MDFYESVDHSGEGIRTNVEGEDEEGGGGGGGKERRVHCEPRSCHFLFGVVLPHAELYFRLKSKGGERRIRSLERSDDVSRTKVKESRPLYADLRLHEIRVLFPKRP